jgi:hypothetical protein
MNPLDGFSVSNLVAQITDGVTNLSNGGGNIEMFMNDQGRKTRNITRRYRPVDEEVVESDNGGRTIKRRYNDYDEEEYVIKRPRYNDHNSEWCAEDYRGPRGAWREYSAASSQRQTPTIYLPSSGYYPQPFGAYGEPRLPYHPIPPPSFPTYDVNYAPISHPLQHQQLYYQQHQQQQQQQQQQLRGYGSDQCYVPPYYQAIPPQLQQQQPQQIAQSLQQLHTLSTPHPHQPSAPQLFQQQVQQPPVPQATCNNGHTASQGVLVAAQKISDVPERREQQVQQEGESINTKYALVSGNSQKSVVQHIQDLLQEEKKQHSMI